MTNPRAEFANIKKRAENIFNVLSHYPVRYSEALEVVAIALGHNDYWHFSKRFIQIDGSASYRVPSFFRALCLKSENNDDDDAYNEAGSHFGLHCASMLEPADDPDMLQFKLADLASLLDQRNDDDVFAWMSAEFPACMALVPSHHRHQFVAGIYAVHDDRDITKL